MSDPLGQTAGVMKMLHDEPRGPGREKVLTTFGRGRLVRVGDGRLELRGGSLDDLTEAREWISMFMPECVLRTAAATGPTGAACRTNRR